MFSQLPARRRRKSTKQPPSDVTCRDEDDALTPAPPPAAPPPDHPQLVMHVTPRVKIHKGGQPGNVNALKSGIYSAALTPEEENELAIVAAQPDLIAEIALLRLVIRRAAMHDENGTLLKDIATGVDTLARAMKVNRTLSGETARQFEKTLVDVLDSLADELGLK